MKPIIEVLADERTACGEAPTWDGDQQRLLWVDNEPGVIFERRFREGITAVVQRDFPAYGLALNNDGRLVIGGPRGVHLLGADGRRTTVLENPDGGDYAFNDIIAGPAGQLYAGSLHWGAAGRERLGALFLITATRPPERVADGIELSNGLAFSPTGDTLYFADSAARVIFAFDLDRARGRLTRQRVFHRVAAADGIPDGLTVDAEGFVWCALWYGGGVIRIDPDGRCERRIALPVKQVSSLAFGGPDLAELYVTSAGAYWASSLAPPGFDGTAPMGGAVYKVRTGLRGKPEYRCAFAS